MPTDTVNTTPLDLSDEQIAKACKSLTEIQHAVEHLYTIIKNQDKSKINQNDRDTMLYVMHSYYKELCEILDYTDAELKRERDQAHMIMDANNRARELTKRLGEKVSLAENGETMSAAINFYTRVFTAYYERLGFHYASETYMNMHGIEYEFSAEIETEPELYQIRDKELLGYMQKHIPHIFGKNNDFDINEDGYTAELLATDKNKKQIIDIFAKDFPESYIVGFHDRKNDYGSYSLRLKFFVRFTDIANLYKRVKK